MKFTFYTYKNNEIGDSSIDFKCFIDNYRYTDEAIISQPILVLESLNIRVNEEKNSKKYNKLKILTNLYNNKPNNHLTKQTFID